MNSGTVKQALFVADTLIAGLYTESFGIHKDECDHEHKSDHDRTYFTDMFACNHIQSPFLNTARPYDI